MIFVVVVVVQWLLVVHEWLVVVVFCGDWVVFALVMDFKEVMLTSPSELAHCGGGVKAILTMSKYEQIFSPDSFTKKCFHR